MTETSTYSLRRRQAVALGAALLAAAALSGCSAASTSSSASAAPAAGGVDVVGAPTGDTAKDAAPGSETPGLLGAPLTAATSARSIVITAAMSVRVDDVARSTADLASVAATHDATIATQSTSAGGDGPQPLYPTNPDGSSACPKVGCVTSYASSTTTLRVDNDKASALIADLAKLGTVLSSTRSSDDVTAQVADVDARVRNAQASLARVRALMTKATSVGDVVALEGELSKREADLEALQARQRTLADQSAQATVTVALLSTDAPVVAESATGFVAGLKAGWDAFSSALVGALTVLGALLPFLVVLVPAGLLARWWLRRRTPQQPAPLPAPMTD